MTLLRFERDLNMQSPAWKSRALPLCYCGDAIITALLGSVDRSVEITFYRVLKENNPVLHF